MILWQCQQCGADGEGFPRRWANAGTIADHVQKHEDEIEDLIDGPCPCGRDYSHNVQ